MVSCGASPSRAAPATPLASLMPFENPEWNQRPTDKGQRCGVVRQRRVSAVQYFHCAVGKWKTYAHGPLPLQHTYGIFSFLLLSLRLCHSLNQAVAVRRHSSLTRHLLGSTATASAEALRLQRKSVYEALMLRTMPALSTPALAWALAWHTTKWPTIGFQFS